MESPKAHDGQFYKSPKQMRFATPSPRDVECSWKTSVVLLFPKENRVAVGVGTTQFSWWKKLPRRVGSNDIFSQLLVDISVTRVITP